MHKTGRAHPSADRYATLTGMQRRHFLTSAAALVAAACTPETETSGQQTSVSVDASTTSSSAPDTTSTPATSSPTELGRQQALVEPVPTPEPGVAIGDAPFLYGVASGDPEADGIVLWTAVAAQGNADVRLAWDLSLDESFTQVVRSEVAIALAAEAHTTRAVVSQLTPATTYWYRYRVGSFVSAVGRTKTLPAGAVDRFSFAVSSCQARDQLDRWDNHAVLAEDDGVDLVLWLGDYIYEDGARTVSDYRDRYREARADERLQRSSGAHPWACTWDDHEVVNDYDSDVARDRRAAAYQAWWEFIPTRLPRPGADGLRVYRSFDVGDLARIVLLDCRQYATAASVLGPDQLSWLAEAVDHGGRQTIVASPLMMSSLGVGDLVPSYAFEAVPDEQAEIREILQAAPQATVVSGDLHASMELVFAEGVAEYMAPPLSSSFPLDLASALAYLPLVSANVVSASATHGYLRVDLRPAGLSATTVPEE